MHHYFRLIKKYLGVNAAILSNCLEVIGFNITDIISVTLAIPCTWPCHCVGASVHYELTAKWNLSISETQAGKAQ